MLGTATLGAVWCSASPDFGVKGVLDRLQQVEPEVLVSVEAVVYNGKVHDHLAKLSSVAAALPSVKIVVVVPFVRGADDVDVTGIPNAVLSANFLSSEDETEVPFVQVAFDDPIFIMFSSGTTGAPKCIVHGVGGTLLQIVKEHRLHCDLRRDDVMAYYTTTGWMMWQWLVTGLHTGCTLFLYDGSPLLPGPAALFDLTDRFGITVLGTGAKWLSVLEGQGVNPRSSHDLGSLRCILSTGSPLTEKSFRYVYNSIKKDLLLGSISGGTDIISCFMGCCPLLPVHEGEIQCPMLAMGIQVWGAQGQQVWDEPGELVCTVPFPSMPTCFWGAEGEHKYRKAYFSKFGGVWSHGDYCIERSGTGGFVMLGRSDGTLNPCGVRFGSAEIYAIVEGFSEVQDSVCVGQRRAVDGEERVVLFLKLALPEERLTPQLTKGIASAIRQQLSARHVPSVILPVADIPYTVSGKKVEVAVRQTIHGETVANRSALANPEALDLYRDLPQLAGW